MRRGLTLIELVIVIVIIAVLAALLVSGIMQVREASHIALSKHNVKQIILAVHSFGDVNQGRLPVVGSNAFEPVPGGGIKAGKKFRTLFREILPYVGGEVDRGPILVVSRRDKKKFRLMTVFLSPADPSVQRARAQGAAVSSYAANGTVFVGHPRFPTTFVDGTSTTIAFAEHYSSDCHGHSFPYWDGTVGFLHRATFADIGDVVPLTVGSTTGPSTAGKTFQVAPTTAECTPFLAQTPHPSGMIVGMADGSVRQIAPHIASATYWGAVTAKSNDSVGVDW